MAKTLYEVRVIPKNGMGATKRGTGHPDTQTHMVFLVSAASISFALMALEDDEAMIPAAEVAKIEVNVCTRYIKLIKAQESI